MKPYVYHCIPAILLSLILPGLVPVTDAGEPIHFAFFNPDNEAKDPVTAVSAMKPFSDFIGEEIGRDIVIHYVLRKKDLERLYSTYKVGIGLLSPLYVIENMERLQIEPFVIPFLGEDTTYRLMLVVQKKSGLKSLEELKGKSLAYTALGEENLDFLNKLVFNNELQVETYFSKLIEVTSPSSAIMSVMYSQVDCACVTSGLFETMKELNPQVNRDLTGVFLSPKILRSPMCFMGGNIPENLKEKFSKIMYSMHETPLGQQTLMPFKVEGFKPVDTTPFDQMKQALLASAKTVPVTTQPREKVAVERIADVAPPSSGTVTIGKTKHNFNAADNTLAFTVSVTPPGQIATVELVSQLQGKGRETIAMNKQTSGSFTAAIPLPPPAAKTTGEETEVEYIVKSGDTLGKISQKYYGELKKWIQIATYNDLKNPNVIFVGQKLRIKQGGEFENVPVTIWIKATGSSGDVVLSPEQQIVVTR